MSDDLLYTIKYSYKTQSEELENIKKEDICELYELIYHGKKYGIDFVILSDCITEKKLIINRKSINYISIETM